MRKLLDRYNYNDWLSGEIDRVSHWSKCSAGQKASLLKALGRLSEKELTKIRNAQEETYSKLLWLNTASRVNQFNKVLLEYEKENEKKEKIEKEIQYIDNQISKYGYKEVENSEIGIVSILGIDSKLYHKVKKHFDNFTDNSIYVVYPKYFDRGGILKTNANFQLSVLRAYRKKILSISIAHKNKSSKTGRPPDVSAPQEPINKVVKELAGKAEFQHSDGQPKPTKIRDYILENHPEICGELQVSALFTRVKKALETNIKH